MKKILIVDDFDNLRESMAKHLGIEGFSVRQAGNGFEALDMIKQECPDLIITDNAMPKMSGNELIEELHKRGINIPVLFFSSDIDEEFLADKHNVKKILQKPVQFKVLLDAVRDLV